MENKNKNVCKNNNDENKGKIIQWLKGIFGKSATNPYKSTVL